MKVDYDINSRDISQARELILKSDGTRFRIFLEIVTSCLGNCTGCSLSYIHKRDFSPELNLEKIQELKTDGGILYGNFLAAVLSFLIISFVIFLLVKGINSLKKKEEPAPAAPAGPTQEELLAEIRDLLKK